MEGDFEVCFIGAFLEQPLLLVFNLLPNLAKPSLL
jgi:hypothetical protein